MFSARQFKLILLLAGLWAAPPGRAVDPLPPDLENAPLEERAAYWDQVGRRAEEDKRRVGQVRHEERQVLHQAIAHQLQAASTARRETIQTEMAVLAAPADASSGNRYQTLGLGILFLCAVVFAVHKLRPEAADTLRDHLGTDLLTPAALARFLSDAPAGVAAVLSGMRPAPAVAARSATAPRASGEAIEIAAPEIDPLLVLPQYTPAPMPAGPSPRERLRELSRDLARSSEKPAPPPLAAAPPAAAPQDFLSQAAARLDNMRNKLRALDSTETPPAPTLAPVVPPSEPAAPPPPVVSAPLSESAQEFLAQAPALLAALSRLLEQITATDDEMDRQERLINFYLQVHSLTCKAALADLKPTTKLGSALESLLKRIYENPQQATPDTLRTVAAAVELLGDLCVPGLPSNLATDPPVRMLVVDDDALSRRAMTTALQMAFEQPDNVATAQAALDLATRTPYEVIFLDVQMPDVDGFSLCSQIRQTEPNRATPIIFVTSQADAEARVRALECGGSDLLPKPFLLIELTVKALTFALAGRLARVREVEALKR